jgi:AraC family carnitine catabolism transcriptional activator
MGDEARRVGFLLTPAFSLLGLAAAIEPLFIANWLAGRLLYAWQTLSRDGRPVMASSGMRWAVDSGIAGSLDYDTVFVLASFEPKENARDGKIRAWLRRLARYGTELGGIETGSEILAAAGLLDGGVVAVHWDNLEGFREVYPQCRAVAELFTVARLGSGVRLTCAGESSVLDMMLHWIALQHGGALAKEIADHLLLERRRPPGDAQLTAAAPGRPSHPVLAPAIAVMEETVEEPLALPELAARLGLSLRGLQRLFTEHMGVTPLAHYKLVRLARAHALLQQTRLSVTEVALSAGFASPEHFSRLYSRTFGRPPRTDRRQATDAPVLRRHSRP